MQQALGHFNKVISSEIEQELFETDIINLRYRLPEIISNGYFVQQIVVPNNDCRDVLILAYKHKGS